MVVWLPINATQLNKNRTKAIPASFFLRNLGCDQLVSSLPYENCLLLFVLSLLEKNRFTLGVSFLNNLINVTITSSTLLDEVNFNVPKHFSRNFIFIKLSQGRYNYELFKAFRVLYKNLNDIYYGFFQFYQTNSPQIGAICLRRSCNLGILV